MCVRLQSRVTVKKDFIGLATQRTSEISEWNRETKTPEDAVALQFLCWRVHADTSRQLTRPVPVAGLPALSLPPLYG